MRYDPKSYTVKSVNSRHKVCAKRKHLSESHYESGGLDSKQAGAKSRTLTEVYFHDAEGCRQNGAARERADDI